MYAHCFFYFKTIYKMKKLKLNRLGESELEKKEMANLKGGDRCCGCGYHGPSSTYDNQNANAWYGDDGAGSPGGNTYCWHLNGTEWVQTSTK